MPIREKKFYCGKYLDIEIYPITKQEQKQKRKKKEKESKKVQKNLNDKNAKKHLRRILNTNFTDEDVVVHLTYSEKNLASSEEEAVRDRNNFIRRVKNYRKKNGLSELKYVAVCEYKEATKDSRTRTRIHHHIVMSGMDRDTLEKMWKKGRANADRLKENELGYEELANYIAKDPKGKKRWTQSRNLIMPEPKINDYKITRKKVWELSRSNDVRGELERMYSGYIFTGHKVEINDITAGTYIYIKMRRRLDYEEGHRHKRVSYR